jgi:O-antigen/teichoic acid export membrane protein
VFAFSILIAPADLGEQVFGASWVGGSSLVGILLIGVLIQALCVGAAVEMRALGQARILRNVSALFALVLLAASTLLGMQFGVTGVAAAIVLRISLMLAVLEWLRRTKFADPGRLHLSLDDH